MAVARCIDERSALRTTWSSEFAPSLLVQPLVLAKAGPQHANARVFCAIVVKWSFGVDYNVEEKPRVDGKLSCVIERAFEASEAMIRRPSRLRRTVEVVSGGDSVFCMDTSSIGKCQTRMGATTVGDIDVLEARLKVVSYFHLSGYMRFFRDAETQRFRAGTSLDDVWSLYRFDRRLRLLLLDAIEKIEQALKSVLLNEFGARQIGAFDYLESAYFPRIDKKFHADLVQYLTLPPDSPSAKTKARHRKLLGIPFVRDFVTKYQESRVPFWMAVEVLSFGQLVRLASGTST